MFNSKIFCYNANIIIVLFYGYLLFYLFTVPKLSTATLAIDRNVNYFTDARFSFLLTVISVSSARQVIDALNAEGPEIDIILSEVDLPMAKGMKMLKYITRDKELRRIPVISKFWFLNCQLITLKCPFGLN